MKLLIPLLLFAASAAAQTVPYTFKLDSTVKVMITVQVPKPKPDTVTLTVRDTIRIPVPVPIIVRDTVTIRDTVRIPCPPMDTRLRLKPTPFSVYLQWDSVPGALEYDVYRGDSLLTVINGLDTWDAILEPSTSYTYSIVTKTAAFRNYTTRTLPAITRPTTMIADRTDISGVTVQGGRITSHRFAPNDVGKVISLRAARSAKWYREAPLWWHGFIVDVDAGGVAKLSAGCSDVTNTYGYWGTNNYNAWRLELADTTPRTMTLTKGYIIDAFRDSWWIANVKNAQGNKDMGPKLSNRALRIKGGELYFGEEDCIGDAIHRVNPPYYTTNMPNIGVIHDGGALFIDSKIFGPQSQPLKNGEPYRTEYFYQANSNKTAKQVFFTGTFGDSSNYLNGFFRGFKLQTENVPGDKNVLAFINATVANQELATVGATNNRIGVYDYNTRFLLRNSRIIGTGRNSASLPVKGWASSDGIITVDSIAHPEFTFRTLAIWEENPSTRNILMKLPATVVPCCNAFTGVIWRPSAVVLSPYTARVPVQPTAQANAHLKQGALPLGAIVLNTAEMMQPSIGIEGHILYHNLIEIEAYRSSVSNYNNAFIRMNGIDNLVGNYRQWSLVGMKYTPPAKVSPQFEPMRQMGYYLQYSTGQFPPLIQFQPMGFLGTRLIR